MASTISYPKSLPHLDGITDTPPDTRLRTQTDIGPAKVRNRYSYAPRIVTGTLALSSQQRIEFDAFYGIELKGGSLSFNWEDPKDDSLAEMRFMTVSQFSMVKSGPVTERRWSVSVTLEILGAA